MTRDELIKKALHAYHGVEDRGQSWEWSEESVKSMRAALAVFEEAHAPTSDEREALRIVEGAKKAYLSAYPGDDHRERFADLDDLAAGFRRSEVLEPSAIDVQEALDALAGSEVPEPSAGCCDGPGGPERCGDCPLDRVSGDDKCDYCGTEVVLA